MEKDIRALLECFKSVQETLSRINELEERIATHSIRLTPSYENIGAGKSGGSKTSQIERYVETMLELQRELIKCKSRLELVQIVSESGVLTEMEHELLEWLQLGGTMSDFARIHNIYSSNVYKIRDKALNKVLKFVQITPKCSELWCKC